MQFHDLPLLITYARNSRHCRFEPEEFYRTMLVKALEQRRLALVSGEPVPHLGAYNHIRMEQIWTKHKRPYYCVWPGIITPLMRMRLDNLPVANVKLPDGLPALCFRFPVGKVIPGLTISGHPIRSVVALRARIVDVPDSQLTPGKDNGGDEGLTLWVNHGETDPEGWPVLTYVNLLMSSGIKCVEEALQRGTGGLGDYVEVKGPIQGDPVEGEAIRNVVRIVCACLLMRTSGSSGLLQVDPLSKDEGKDLTVEQLMARAHKRGKVGWHVGKGIEVSPHYRNAHPCLVWTGEGRKIPRVVMREGSVIHKDKIETLPTGYDEKTEK